MRLAIGRIVFFESEKGSNRFMKGIMAEYAYYNHIIYISNISFLAIFFLAQLLPLIIFSDGRNGLSLSGMGFFPGQFGQSSSSPIIKVAGWIDASLVASDVHSPPGQLRCDGVPAAAEAAELAGAGGAVVFHGNEGGIRWSGVVTLERGSRLRLVAPNHFRLSYGRARDVRPRVVLMMGALPGSEASNEFVVAFLFVFLARFAGKVDQSFQSFVQFSYCDILGYLGLHQ